MHGDNDFRAFKELGDTERCLDRPHRIVAPGAEQQDFRLVEFVNQGHVPENAGVP